MEDTHKITKVNQTDLSTCIEGLEEAQKSLEAVCSGMISCYTVADADNADFKKLRNNVTADLVTYFKIVKPASANALKNIKNYFETYHDGFSNYVDFAENVGAMKAEVKLIVEELTFIKEMHTKVVAHASKHAIEANKLITALEKLSAEYSEQIRKNKHYLAKVEKEVQTLSSPWWMAMNGIPIVGSIVALGIYGAAMMKEGKINDMRHGINVKLANQEKFLFATECVQKYLEPSIKAYLSAIMKIQSFFVALQVEMSLMEDDMTKTEEKRSMAKIYFNKIVKRSKEIAGKTTQSIVYLDAIEATFLGMNMLNSMSATELWDKMYKENKLQLAQDLKKDFEKSPSSLKNVKETWNKLLV